MHISSPRTPRRIRLLVIPLVLAAAATALWIFHGLHSDAHDHAGHADATLDHGKRWATDVPLRTGMRQIREVADPMLNPPTTSPLTSAQAKAAATAIQENVNSIIANCKLAPAADATLHTIIADLLSGAGRLAEDPDDQEARRILARALERYPEYFDHPGWAALPTS